MNLVFANKTPETSSTEARIAPTTIPAISELLRSDDSELALGRGVVVVVVGVEVRVEVRVEVVVVTGAKVVIKLHEVKDSSVQSSFVCGIR